MNDDATTAMERGDGSHHVRTGLAVPRNITPSRHTIEIAFVLLVILVDEKGFEPSASSLRTRRSPS